MGGDFSDIKIYFLKTPRKAQLDPVVLLILHLLQLHRGVFRLVWGPEELGQEHLGLPPDLRGGVRDRETER